MHLFPAAGSTPVRCAGRHAQRNVNNTHVSGHAHTHIHAHAHMHKHAHAPSGPQCIASSDMQQQLHQHCTPFITLAPSRSAPNRARPPSASNSSLTPSFTQRQHSIHKFARNAVFKASTPLLIQPIVDDAPRAQPRLQLKRALNHLCVRACVRACVCACETWAYEAVRTPPSHAHGARTNIAFPLSTLGPGKTSPAVVAGNACPCPRARSRAR